MNEHGPYTDVIAPRIIFYAAQLSPWEIIDYPSPAPNQRSCYAYSEYMLNTKLRGYVNESYSNHSVIAALASCPVL